MTNVTTNGAILTAPVIDEVESMLDENMSTPNQAAAQHQQSTTIDADRVLSAIDAVRVAAYGLDHDHILTMIAPLAELTADIDDDGRKLIKAGLETRLGGVDADWFMGLCPAPKGKPAFEPMSMADLLSMPPKEWLIENVVGAKNLVMLYGGSGSGKTHIAIDMIFAAMQGGMFARRFPVARRLNVAYAAGEGVSGLRDRFEAVRDFYSANDPLGDCDRFFTFFSTVPQLYVDQHTEFKETMLNFITEWKARQSAGQCEALDILFIDTLHTASVGSDENSAKDIGVVMSMAKKAVRELGCSVVLIHHTGKNGNKERGSSAMRGDMDAMILVERIGETGTKAKMICGKLKDGKEWDTQTFDLVEHLNSVRVWWDEPISDDGTDKRKSETAGEILGMLGSAEGELTAKRIAEAMAATPQAVNRVLNRLAKDELISRSQNSRGTWCYAITEKGKLSDGKAIV